MRCFRTGQSDADHLRLRWIFVHVKTRIREYESDSGFIHENQTIGWCKVSIFRKYGSVIRKRTSSMVVMVMACLIHDGKAYAQNMASYCRIPVFEVPFHPLGGQATFDMFGNPVILIDPTITARFPFPHGRNFLRFLTAHECAHHVNGHVFNLARAGAFGGYVLLQMSHSFEMEADCEAARMLSSRGDSSAIESAVWVFMNSNPFPTPTHPGGAVRAHNIRRCAG